MSYRELDEDLTHPEVSDVPSHAHISIMNGLITEITIPCSYVETDADGVETLTAIDLGAEGYVTSGAVVAFASPPAGLTATVEIDTDPVNVVQLVISAQCPSAVTADVECEMSVLASRGVGTAKRTDCIIRGPLTITKAPLPA